MEKKIIFIKRLFCKHDYVLKEKELGSMFGYFLFLLLKVLKEKI